MKTSAILSVSLLSSAAAFAPAPVERGSTSLGMDRRAAAGQIAAGAAVLAGLPNLANAAAGQEAEYNQLVEMLKARSDENKEANANYAMRANKMSERDFKDAKNRRPKLIIVSTSKGEKIFTKEEFSTLDRDGKIETKYGTRMKQGGGEMKDYNDITYILKD